MEIAHRMSFNIANPCIYPYLHIKYGFNKMCHVNEEEWCRIQDDIHLKLIFE